jgi:hypothetical protein
MPRTAAAPTDRDVLRRVLETGGRCHAEIWLQNRKTAEWYCWDFCSDKPGHDGPHEVWSDRDQETWATWGPERPLSRQVDLAGAEARPSPWTAGEIAVLRSVLP